MPDRVVIRRLSADEIDRLIPLCVEHAEFEHATPVEADGLADKLTAALLSDPPLWFAWVAQVDEELVGYASVNPEFSTWTGEMFWHLDCLYVVAAMRGLGLGRQLLEAVCASASEHGICELQWQTPDWNLDAQRFYARLGAKMQRKARFTLDLARDP